MTTNNTHHEQHDVDATVVEQQSVPNSTTEHSASDTTLPTEAEVQANTEDTETATHTQEVPQAESSTLTSTPQDASEELQASQPSEQAEESENSVPNDQPEQPAVEAENTPAQPEVTSEVPSEATNESSPSEETAQTNSQPVAEQTEEAPTPTETVQETAQIELSQVEAEVRPFTAFIEEFRQAEARLNASVQESEAEVFHLFVPADTDIVLPASLSIVEEPESSSLEAVVESIERAQAETVAAFPQELSNPTTESKEEVSSAATEEKPADEKPSRAHKKEAAHSQEETNKVEQKTEAAAGEEESVEDEGTANKQASHERAVSPLLRPASRIRMPRHGATRHRETFAEKTHEEPAKEQHKAEAEKPAEKTTAPTTEQAEPEKPRPARRYRFDRPAASAVTHTATPPRAESIQKAAEPVVETHAKPAAIQPPAPVTSDQVLESKSASRQENVVAETPAPAEKEHGRKRQSHDRAAKEQQQAVQAASVTPVQEVQAAAVEVAKQAQEVAPEDLPPLEYSELQKASSRRRRRHRSTTSTSSSTTVVAANAMNVQPQTPVESASQQTSMVARETSQVTPVQYTIVSGYTVNQMNQGNETSSPFMGPDPSPARGSLFTREGRVPSRSEIQRATPPAYTPARTSEAGMSSAMINQLSNAISQSIQTQTDRMVSEFRRMAQAPTNISVALPPFPSNERVGVFVDVANLLYSARTLRLSVDFGKLLDFLRGNRRLIRAHAYCPTSPQPSDEQMFLQAVKGLGYRITTKNYKTFSSGAKKADLDLDLCMDVVRVVDGRAVDCIVLVSGDSDFMPMLDYCSDHGVRVEVAAFDEAMSATLRQSCDLFINLSMLDDILANS